MRSACLPVTSNHALRLRKALFGPVPSTLRTVRSYAIPYVNSNDEQSTTNERPGLDGSPKRVAILGGGISGLSTAWYLLKALPNAKITIYESTNRLGGWINSEKVAVQGGEVVFEWGPRSLRPDLNGAGTSTVRLLDKLRLDSSIVCVNRRSPAAISRFIYYPDHLVRMPAPGSGGLLSRLLGLFYAAATVAREPLFSGVWRAVRGEPFVDTRSPEIDDESVGDFIGRRFGRKVADNLLSAVFHGIYAGDIYKLSARTLLPRLWYMERRDPDGSGVIAEVGEMMMMSMALITSPTPEWLDLVKETEGMPSYRMLSSLMKSSVYTFSNGLGQLVSSLENSLRKSQNVDILTNTPVTRLNFDKPSRTVAVHSSVSSAPQEFDYVVSSLPPTVLTSSTSPTSPSGSSLDTSSFEAACSKANDASTVMVVNLYYSEPRLIPNHLRGFGYLLPRSVPLEQNPERALGVIFGSESSGHRGPVVAAAAPETPTEFMGSGEDHVPAMGQDTALGTKLTVMLGGHWWEGWSDSDIPTPDEAIQLSKTLLARHLNIHEAPEVAKARLAKNAIPQYRVGYRKTMTTIHQGLMAQYEGRLKVVGPWWQGGVGVNDCILKAHQTALYIGKGWDERTGLEMYGKKEQWYILNMKNRTLRPDEPSVDS